jgi:hypothetical protein
MVAPGDWTAGFNASVFALLGLEIVGCVLASLLLGGVTPAASRRFSGAMARR